MPKNDFLFVGAGLGLLYFLTRRQTGGISHASVNLSATDEIIFTVRELQADNFEISELPISLVLGLIQAESNFDIDAKGSNTEIGLMQLKPPTYKWMIEKYFVDEHLGGIYDLENNILAGCLYLAQQIKRTGSMIDGIHAYNTGYQGWKDGRRNWIYVNRVIENKENWEAKAA